MKKSIVLAALLGLGSFVWGCSSVDGTDPSNQVQAQNCNIDSSLIFDGGPGKDGIPALTNPEWTDPEAADFMSDHDRVIGLLVQEQPYAIPHNILWHHEIANIDFPGVELAVSYCPLTGSGIAFDRGSVGGARFGVSGLLYRSNLIMYDRTSDESLWAQMSREGSCGGAAGTQLATFPVFEMSWRGWRTLYPDTQVLSEDTGFRRDYTFFPYGSYESLDNNRTLFPVGDLDERRPIKERVLGLPSGTGGTAFPFGELDTSPVTVTQAEYNGRPVAVLWDRARVAALAFYTDGAGGPHTLETDDGQFVDAATGSTWNVTGLAVDGPLAGDRLEPVKEAYVAFWFAWAAFHPETRLYANDNQ